MLRPGRQLRLVFLRISGVMLMVGGLTACDFALRSEQPLFRAGGQAPQPGLWAFMRGSCTPPSSGAIETWPECAAPVWLNGDVATFLFEGPVRADFVISDSAPGIVRLAPRRAASMDDAAKGFDDDGYAYAVVEAEGPSPFGKARLWAIDCRHAEQPAADVTDEDACRAKTEQAVRLAGALARKDEPTWTAVLVSPAAAQP